MKLFKASQLFFVLILSICLIRCDFNAGSDGGSNGSIDSTTIDTAISDTLTGEATPETEILADLTSFHENFIPYNTTEDVIIHHMAYTLSYSETHEQAIWVAYRLTADMIGGDFKRKDNFRQDPDIDSGSAQLVDYKGSGYDRGHLCPAGDMTWDETAMSESFFMSNMSPQVAGFNRGIWRKLEEKVRGWATANEEIYVVTSGHLTEGLDIIGENEVSIPAFYYKVILDIHEPDFRGIAFIFPNEKSDEPLSSFAVSIDMVEELTGIDFYPDLPNIYEDEIEAIFKLEDWDLQPAI